ncbi:NAD(P)H-dependent glycerol-3-phosphate dehydrogenase [Sulfurimonas sp. SAG-AH-194-C20]|nr:NAD(P)H-dependent glycerol-3-phosphate dehydrogenase [Sulfurimonas sp. SAG-AH-194-C20]MDF1879448.1 NAD(P)H-dependent glycerol-3-phosphate dehydrogenase [Sulfurimonas sp. SAG-AH-194-C20]
MKVGVIGAGKWGSALAFAFSEKNEVVITSRRPRDLKNFVSLQEALSCEYLIITVPAQEVAAWLKDNFTFSGQKILVASKGIEASSGKFLNEIYSAYVPSENIAFLSGPSFAIEVQKSLPTALVVNSLNQVLSKEFAALFPSFIKAYTSIDVVGAEVSGAYKNVIAIAAGICSGLELGNNAAAALISRGLVEMQRFGLAYGAKPETFVGLGGAGDLFLTASSHLSRNFRVGLGLAAGKSQEDILQELGEVAEGIGTTYAISEILKTSDLHLPIAKEVYEMLEGKNPKESLRDLLSS